MIENDEQLRNARGALAQAEEALRRLKHRAQDANPELFAAMAQDYVAMISSIRSEIDQYIGVPDVEESIAPIWIKLRGEGARFGHAASSELVKTLDRFRRGVQSIVTYTREGTSELGRPSSEIARMVDFEVVAFRPGSLRLGLGLPPLQLSFLEQRPPVEQALRIFLTTSRWVATSGAPESYKRELPDPGLRQVALAQLRSFAPQRTGRVTEIELSGAYLPTPEPIRLTASDRDFIRDVESAVGPAEEEADQVEYVGYLRELDLDKRRAILRPHPGGKRGQHCVVAENLLDEAHRRFGGEQVRATGVRRGKLLYVEDLSDLAIEE